MHPQNRRPAVLSAFTVLLVLNATVTAVHYLLIFLRVIPIKGGIGTVVEFTFADAIVTVIPSFIAAYGLWRLRRWGLLLGVLLSGGYLHGMIALLARAVASSQYGVMNFVSIYFVLFSIILIVYLWNHQELFGWD